MATKRFKRSSQNHKTFNKMVVFENRIISPADKPPLETNLRPILITIEKGMFD